jgi:hypothetical protein
MKTRLVSHGGVRLQFVITQNSWLGVLMYEVLVVLTATGLGLTRFPEDEIYKDSSISKFVISFAGGLSLLSH